MFIETSTKVIHSAGEAICHCCGNTMSGRQLKQALKLWWPCPRSIAGQYKWLCGYLSSMALHLIWLHHHHPQPLRKLKRPMVTFWWQPCACNCSRSAHALAQAHTTMLCIPLVYINRHLSVLLWGEFLPTSGSSMTLLLHARFSLS